MSGLLKKYLPANAGYAMSIAGALIWQIALLLIFVESGQITDTRLAVWVAASTLVWLLVIFFTRVQGRGRVKELRTERQQLQHELEERRRIEDALRRSEERFARIFNTSPVSIVLSRLEDSRIVDINPAGLRLMGYNTKEEYIGQDVISLGQWVNPEDRDRMIRQLKEAGFVHDLAHQYRTRTGEIRHALVSIEVIDIDGQPHKLSMSIDITELRETQRQLEQTTANLRAIIQAVPDLYFRANVHGAVIDYFGDDANRAFWHLPDDVIGKQLIDVLPLDVATQFLDALTGMFETDQFVVIEYPMRGNYGSDAPSYYEARFAPLPGKEALVVVRDITERRLSEESLRASERRYRMLMEQAVEAIWNTDFEGNVILANTAAADLLGYSLDELIGTNVANLLLPKENDPVKFRRTRTQSMREHRIQRKDGSIIYVDGSIKTVGDGMVQNIFHDITDARAAEEALWRSEDLFRQLTENITAATYVYDLGEQAFAYVSPVIGRILRSDEINAANYGMTMLEAAHPDDHAAVLDALDNLSKGTLLGEFEFRVTRADGAVRWLNTRDFPIHNEQGELYRIAGLIEDVTERKETVQALYRSQQLFQQVSENIGEVLYILDLKDNAIVYANSAYTTMWKEQAESFIENRMPDILRIIHPEDHARFIEVVEQLNQGVTGEFEYRVVDPGGLIRWLRSRTFPIHDEDGAIYRVIGLIEDVTERKRMEQQMLETSSLRTELEKQREISRLKENFVTLVSHEFRTPLTIIVSSSELLDKYLDRLTPEKRAEHLAKIKAQTSYMINLLEDILELNSIQSGTMSLKLTRFDFVAFCQTIVERFQWNGSASQKIILDAPSEAQNVFMDRKLAELIIAHLLSNAAKFSADDGEIVVSLKPDGDHIVLEVRDQGIGIPQADLPRIFEPFHRADNISTRRGTGLGLPIVKNSVDVHGGAITITSQEGKGTTVRVQLPLMATN